MKARHEEVKNKKHLNAACKRAGIFEPEAGRFVLLEMLIVLSKFEAEKDQAKDHSGEQEEAQQPLVTSLCAVFGECQHQAAGQQDCGIDRSEDDVHISASGIEGLWMAHAIDGVGQEEAAEHHDLGGQENPHPDACGFALLFGRGKLLATGECGRLRQVATPLS
jgi:hypothetical protein